MSSTEEYRIICFIPRSKDAFSVNIEKSRLVDELKDMIKAKKSPIFKGWNPRRAIIIEKIN